MDLILASTSPIRGTLLANAGVAYAAEAPGVDEATVKANATGDDAELATRLAEAKALAVSRRRTRALVIGSDSLVSVTGFTNKTVPGTYALEVSRLATHGTLVGQGAAGLTITAGVDDTLGILLDGVSATVTLAAGTYANAAALINNEPGRPWLTGTDGEAVPYNCQVVPYGPNSSDTLSAK